MSGDSSRSFASRVQRSGGVWPEPPDWFSFSSLLDIGTCPRRWALRHASFPDLFDTPGYPDVPHVRSLFGDVVHGALETVLRAMSKAGCDSLTSADAAAVLKSLGGFSVIIRSVLDEQLERLEGNERTVDRMATFRRTLQDQLPEMRQQVQATLARLAFVPSAGPRVAGSERSARFPLPNGTFSEVDLRASNLRLAGRVDLITITDDEIRITDFKTGVASEHHLQQLHVYALLWLRDRDRNPTGRPASEVVISYQAADVTTASPGEADLNSVEAQVKEQVASAQQMLGSDPPPALPGEQCTFCTVRHLCEDYWASIDHLPVRDGFQDLELRIRGVNGPRSWHATITRPQSKEGVKCVLRAPSGRNIDADSEVRALGAAVELDDELGVSVSVVPSTEVFALY